MDYSNLSTDPDHPEGSSPWQTSPGASRTVPERDLNDNKTVSNPPSPSAAVTASPRNADGIQNGPPARQEGSATVEASKPADERQEFQSQTCNIKQSPARGLTYNVQDMRFQGPPMTEEEIQQEHLRQQKINERRQQILHTQQHQRGPGSYQSNEQEQNAKPMVYRLVAKITALERTGKKEPAIHFDVQVCGLVFNAGPHPKIRKTAASIQLASSI